MGRGVFEGVGLGWMGEWSRVWDGLCFEGGFCCIFRDGQRQRRLYV